MIVQLIQMTTILWIWFDLVDFLVEETYCHNQESHGISVSCECVIVETWIWYDHNHHHNKNLNKTRPERAIILKSGYDCRLQELHKCLQKSSRQHNSSMVGFMHSWWAISRLQPSYPRADLACNWSFLCMVSKVVAFC